MSRTLITGATGFLGQHLTRLLADSDATNIRVLARSCPQWLEALGVEVENGSITDADAVRRALKGVDSVYHLAGFVSRKADDAHRMHAVHVTGTRLLCEAARELSVKRIVLVSTSGTVAVSRRAEEMPDEDCDAPLDIIARWPYYASKHYQEETARRKCRDDVELITVNPSLLLGPGDERLSSTRDVLSLLNKEIKVIPPGGLNFVDVRDVAAALVSAMEQGTHGRRYLLGAYNWTFREFFGRISRLSKVDGPFIRGRGRWPYFASEIQAALFRGLGRTPPVDPASVEMAEYFWYFPNDRAVEELGFEPRDATETLFDTISYLRENVIAPVRTSS